MSDVVRPFKVLSESMFDSNVTLDHDHYFEVLNRYETENIELRASLFCRGCALVVEVSATSSPYQVFVP